MEILPVHAKINADLKADATPVIQAVADAVHSPLKGVGKILNALVGPWVASRERVTALLRAQTEQDCKRITDGSLTYREGNLLSMPDSSADIYAALHSLNHQADAKRLEAAVLEAVRQISDLPPEQIADEPLSQTFFNRWRREAEMIDEDELRQWWARILVEETKKPNSISPRTLEVARSLTKEEALLFTRMLKGEIAGIIPSFERGYPQYITYSEALTLQNAGLIFVQNSERTFSSQYFVDNENKGIQVLLANGALVLCVRKEKFSVNCYLFSEAGRCLLPIAQEPRSLNDYIAIVSRISEFSGNTIMSLHPILKRQGQQISWQTIPLWSSKIDEAATQRS